MFSKEEGEGWHMLGDAVMPSSTADAGTMLESFQQIGERTLHGVFGGTSIPELHEAVGAMFNSKPMVELNSSASLLPDLEVFDPFESGGAAGLDTAAAGTPESGLSDSVQFEQIGKAATDVLSKMQDMLGSLFQGPMGFFAGLFKFLLTIFTEILSGIGRILQETARAAAALAADAWKKHLEMLG